MLGVRLAGIIFNYRVFLLILPLFGISFLGFLLFTSLGNRRNLKTLQIEGTTFDTTVNLENLAATGEVNFNEVQQLINLFSGAGAEDFLENLSKLEQESGVLEKYVLFRHLTPPPSSKVPYNLPGGVTTDDNQFKNGFSSIIANLFLNKKNGTFIEAGAYDGVAASNTLYLEKVLGWRGLLVECNPVTVPYLRLKRRRAWIADVCLSPTRYPTILNFSNPVKWAPSGRIGDPVDLRKWGVDTEWTQFEVQGIPLYSLLKAVNLTQIDFFSLDVEGAEFEILRTIPFDKVEIRVWVKKLNWNSFFMKVR